MNNTVKQHTPSATAAAMGIAAFVAVGHPIWPEYEAPTYNTAHSLPTSSVVEQSLVLGTELAARNFGDSIATVYTLLLEDQEPLGAEFEAVWDANASQLYEY